MAVHVPLSLESQSEARLLMLASNNVMSPATGRPIITPSQDMVLGCYYLTAENPWANHDGDRFFASLDDAIRAYDREQIELHAYVWVRYDGEVESPEADKEIVSQETLEDGTVNKIYNYRRVRETADGETICQYIRTTPGRIIFNKAIQDAIAMA